MKAYIISFYQKEVSNEELVTFIDGRREILNWQTEVNLPNTVFIVSNRNASFLSRIIEKKFPRSSFIIAEYILYNSDGLLTDEAWEFLNKPKKA